MTDRIYTIASGQYSDYRVHGAYTTRKLAEEAAAALTTGSPYSDFTVSSMPLDEPIGDMLFVEIMMRRDGSVARVTISTLIDSFATTGWYLDLGNDWFVPITSRRGLEGEGEIVMAYASLGHHDEKRAVKAANERRAQVLAEDGWGTAVLL